MPSPSLHSPVSLATPLRGTPLPSGPALTPPATASSDAGHAYNIQLACSTKTCVNGLQVTLLSSTVDVAKKQVALAFTILDTSGDTSYDDTAIASYTRVTLQSALDGSPYDGYASYEGGTQQGIPFSVQPGQRAQVAIEFDFVPYVGVSYQLLVNMDEMSVNGQVGTSFTLDPVLLSF